MNPDDERCQSGALIRAASERLYRVIGPENWTGQNYGLLGMLAGALNHGLLGRVGGGLFVQLTGAVDRRCQKCRADAPADDYGHPSWLSPESVMAAKLEIRAPAGFPDALDQAA